MFLTDRGVEKRCKRYGISWQACSLSKAYPSVTIDDDGRQVFAGASKVSFKGNLNLKKKKTTSYRLWSGGMLNHHVMLPRSGHQPWQWHCCVDVLWKRNPLEKPKNALNRYSYLFLLIRSHLERLCCLLLSPLQWFWTWGGLLCTQVLLIASLYLFFPTNSLPILRVWRNAGQNQFHPELLRNRLREHPRVDLPNSGQRRPKLRAAHTAERLRHEEGKSEVLIDDHSQICELVKSDWFADLNCQLFRTD